MCVKCQSREAQSYKIITHETENTALKPTICHVILIKFCDSADFSRINFRGSKYCICKAS